MSQDPKISIIIATYNRSDLLPGCFDSVVDQTADKSDYEVIVVNNNSTDTTQQIAEEYAGKHNNFRVVIEEKQGLSHSRNRGYKEAKGEYVAYLDDDAKATRTWVETALKVIVEFEPEIFGGPIDPFYLDEDAVVPWMRPEYNQYSQHGESRWVANEFMSGSNIVLKKSLLEEYGGFNPSFGMVGGKAGFHEETVLQVRAQQEKRKIYYCKELLVYHLVPQYKQHIIHYVHSKYKSGKDALHLWKRDFKFADMMELSQILDEIMREFEAAMSKRDKEQYPYPENYILDRLNQRLVDLGYYNEYFLKDGGLKLRDVLEYFSEAKGMDITDFLSAGWESGFFRNKENRSTLGPVGFVKYTLAMAKVTLPGKLIGRVLRLLKKVFRKITQLVT